MEERTADRIVKFFALLSWAGAIVVGVAGIALMLGSTGAAYNIFFGGLGTDAWSALSHGATGTVLAAAGLLYLALGTGLWCTREWARTVLLALAWASAILSFVSIVIGIAAGAQLRPPVISLIIAALEIWLFQFRTDIKSLFAEQYIEPTAYYERIMRAKARPSAGKRS